MRDLKASGVRDSLAGAGDAWCTGEQAWRAEWGSGELGAKVRGCACWPLRRLEAETCENCLIFMWLLCAAWYLELEEVQGPTWGGSCRRLGQRCLGRALEDWP